jgi:hypothetical protein
VKKKYTYRGKGSAAGFYPSGFVLVPKFRAFLTDVLKNHKDEELSVTIRIRPPRKKKPIVIRFKNGKPYTHRPLDKV